MELAYVEVNMSDLKGVGLEIQVEVWTGPGGIRWRRSCAPHCLRLAPLVKITGGQDVRAGCWRPDAPLREKSRSDGGGILACRR